MLTHVHPKLPMRNKAATKNFYVNQLGFQQLGAADYEEYLMVYKDAIEIHFFLFKEINPAENYGQLYIRLNDIDNWYQSIKSKDAECTPLENKAWRQREFSILDPDKNLLTFGQSI